MSRAAGHHQNPRAIARVLVVAGAVMIGMAISGSACAADANTVGAESVGAGRAAYLRGDYPAAVRAWRRSADRGEAEGLFWLAMTFRDGLATPRNPRRAADYMKRAAEAGHVDAMYLWARMVATGRGVPRDGEAAAHWLQAAATAGQPNAVAALVRRGVAVPDAAPAHTDDAAFEAAMNAVIRDIVGTIPPPIPQRKPAVGG